MGSHRSACVRRTLWPPGSEAAGLGLGSFRLRLSPTKKVVLGGDGGWDYLSADPTTHRVFISRGTYIMVVDADGNLLGKIDNLKGTHGAAIAPDLNAGFTSNGGSNSVTMFDLKTLAPIREINLPAAQGPDGYLYEPVSKRVFVFNGRSHGRDRALTARRAKSPGRFP